jgi:putative intracellular protease/amidase
VSIPGRAAPSPNDGKVSSRHAVGIRPERSQRVILTADKFEDLELFVPHFRLLADGVHVDIAAPSMDEISGEHGYTLTPDMRIDDVDPDDYDLLVIPGGSPTARRRPCDRSGMRRR